ncbi:AEC family transporter [Xanthobacter dioxanivorans]|uniref:AEC family transporter n=1 Tax=Xanthobacter dioxanivorans TaxID=2528964 RepID=A0A974PL49_9HYPH|nr:AEC family transporter [Xanthobacter dioxanivorans]QRG05191.1 AEC family transporter [Xanthobacter dioxanivorans]
MSVIFTALAPVFLIIALGATLRRILLTDPAHWAALEKLTYFVLFPSLLIVSAVKADLSQVNVLAVGGALIGSVVILSGLILLVHRPLIAALAADGPGFTSLFQGAVRWNTYIVLAVAGGLFHAEGITIAALALVAMIPVVNIIAVLVLASFAGRHPPTFGYVIGQLGRNPYIWSCALGAALNATHFPVPAVIVEFGDILGRASLALGLLVVGGGLVLDRLTKPRPIVFASLALKLLVKPAIALVLSLLLGLTGTELVVVAITAAVPSAPNGYVLARQMGGDAPLLAEILTLQIIAAAITLPVVVAVAKMLAG